MKSNKRENENETEVYRFMTLSELIVFYQIGLFTVIEIPLPIVTDAVAELVHVPFAPITETVVDAPGLIV